MDKVAVALVVVVVLLLVGLYAVSTFMSVGLLRAWFVLSAPFVPAAALAGWRVGTRDSRAHISGLDKGIKEVMRAAGQTADLRRGPRQTATQRAPVASDPAPIRLPDPELRHVTAEGGGDIIDL